MLSESQEEAQAAPVVGTDIEYEFVNDEEWMKKRKMFLKCWATVIWTVCVFITGIWVGAGEHLIAEKLPVEKFKP